MRGLHFNEIHGHICSLAGMLQSLTFEERVSCLESIADVQKDAGLGIHQWVWP